MAKRDPKTGKFVKKEPKQLEKEAIESISSIGDVTEDQLYDIFEMGDEKPADMGIVEDKVLMPEDEAVEEEDEPKEELSDPNEEEEVETPPTDPNDDTFPEEDLEVEDKEPDEDLEEPEEESEGEEDTKLDDEILGLLPEDLRGETFDDTVDRLLDRALGDRSASVEEIETKLKREMEEAKEAEKAAANKRIGQLEQEVAKAQKIIQSLASGQMRSAVPTSETSGMPTTLNVPKVRKKLFTKINEDELVDVFDDPDTGISQRISNVLSDYDENVQKMVQEEAREIVRKEIEDRQRRYEVIQFQQQHPDWETLAEEMQTVVAQRPELDHTPGALPYIYEEAKRIRVAKLNRMRRELGLPESEEPTSQQVKEAPTAGPVKAAPSNSPKKATEPKPTEKKTSYTPEELALLKRRIAEQLRRKHASTGHVESSRRSTGAMLKRRKKKEKPSYQDKVFDDMINAGLKAPWTL